MAYAKLTAQNVCADSAMHAISPSLVLGLIGLSRVGIMCCYSRAHTDRERAATVGLLVGTGREGAATVGLIVGTGRGGMETRRFGATSSFPRSLLR